MVYLAFALFFLIIDLRCVFPDINLTAMGSRSGFVGGQIEIDIKLNCGNCSNLIVKDPANQTVNFSRNGYEALVQLIIDEDVKLGTYTWYYNDYKFVYSLMYRLCSEEERLLWHQMTCRIPAKYEVCVITLTTTGTETMCNPLTTEICHKTHMYDNTSMSSCVGSINYNTLCEAFVAGSSNNINDFVTHITDKFLGSCSQVSESSSLTVLVESDILIDGGNCTSIDSNVRPYGSTLQFSDNQFRWCFQCAPNVKSVRYDNVDSTVEGYCPIKTSSAPSIGTWIYTVTIKYYKVNTSQYVGQIFFKLLSIKPNIRFVSNTDCTRNNPHKILKCDFDPLEDDVKSKAKISSYEIKFKINGRSVIGTGEQGKFVLVDEAGIYECIGTYYYYGFYWFEKLSVTRMANFSVTENCVENKNTTNTTAVTKNSGNLVPISIVVISVLCSVAFIIGILFCCRKIIQKRKMDYMTQSFYSAEHESTKSSD